MVSDMRREGNHYVLSTGKKFYANNGILGIGEDGVYEGCDGDVEYGPGYGDEDLDRDRFTPEEAREVAEYAKKMWDEWLEERTP